MKKFIDYLGHIVTRKVVVDKKPEIPPSPETSSSIDRFSTSKRKDLGVYAASFLVLLILLGGSYLYKNSKGLNGLFLVGNVPTKEFDLNTDVPPGNLLILIEADLRDGLQNQLDIYAADVKRELNWDTVIKEVTPDKDILSLKSLVKNYYNTEGLDGLLLIGNIPTGNMYHPDVLLDSAGYALWDAIYQDINDDCVYSVKKDAFDYSIEECNPVRVQPFWVARLTPNSTTESALSQLKNYFERNHKFRTGDFAFAGKQLVYLPLLNDLTATDMADQIEAFKESFTIYRNYDESDLLFVNPTQRSSDQEYLSAISEPYQYEAITYSGDGSPVFHQKNIYSENINNPSFFLIHFLSSSVGRFTVPDYIAGKYLFGGGLLAYAPSATVSQILTESGLFDREMYVMLSQGVPFYKALKFRNGGGNNILGDPTLKMRYGHTFSSGARAILSASEIFLSDAGNEQTITLANIGNEPLLFDLKLNFLRQKYSSSIVGTSYSIDANTIVTSNMPNKLMPEQSTVINFQPDVAAQTQDLPAGRYEAIFSIVSNDSQHPLIEIPFHFTKQ